MWVTDISAEGSGLLFQEDDEDEDSSSGVSDSDVLLQDGYERAETRPILSVRKYPLHAFTASEISCLQTASQWAPASGTGRTLLSISPLIPHAYLPQSLALAR